MTIPSGNTDVNRVPLPPPDARVVTTACEYCPVACGYKAFSWPIEVEGGPSASENALGVDFPTGPLTGRWPSTNMHTVVTIDGRPHNVLIMPDPDADVVNVGGNHSVRGGTLAKKLYRPDGPTHDRLQHPLLRVNGTLQQISWDAAVEITASLIGHVVDTYGELAMGFKHFSYEFFENTYAITKFAYGAIGTPNVAPHHNTAHGTDTPGADDTGVDAFSAAFVDYSEADVLLIAGTDPYETKTVAFTQWIAPGGAKIVHIDPRRTFTSAYAEKNGGVHLQVWPGTDAWALGAISRLILERGWEDTEFIRDHVTNSRADLEAESWRRRQFGRTWEEFRAETLGNDEYRLDQASAITRVDAEKLERAAELLAAPVNGVRPKTTLLYEKGLYWTHNYENTAAMGNLSVLLGARGRPGRATSRMGGHQRGGMAGAAYPIEKSPTEFDGHKLEMDCDLWTVQGNTRMVWSFGNDWVNGSGASQHIASRLRDMTRHTSPQLTSAVLSTVIGQLQERLANGGMFIVQSEIYLNDQSEFADLVLPAATWGEGDFTRCNAERRLRLYGKIMDPPGEARPDWWAVARVAQRMGIDGFDWADTNAVFEESGPRSVGKRVDYSVLVEEAQRRDTPAHDMLRSYGTTGLQAPIKLEGGSLVGTVRLHEDLVFKTGTGKSNFVTVDLDTVKQRNDLLGPNSDEFWVLSGRVNHLWQSLYDDKRKPHLIQRFPANFVEINPDDAQRMGIESGDMVAIESDRVRTADQQTASGAITAVAYVTDQVQPGTVFTNFHYPGSPANAVVTADAASQPINPRQPFKFGRGRLTRIGPTNLAETMSFAPRNLA